MTEGRGAMRCGGQAWTRMRKAFEEVLATAGPEAVLPDFAVSVQYDAAPANLTPSDHPLGWTCRIVGGVVVGVETAPSRDVDIHVRADCDGIAEPSAFLVDGDPQRVAEFARSARSVANGRLTVEGDTTCGRPCLLWRAHDTMARDAS